MILNHFEAITVDGKHSLTPGRLLVSTTYLLFDVYSNSDPSADSIIAEKLQDIAEITREKGVIVDSLIVRFSNDKKIKFNCGKTSTCEVIKTFILSAKEASTEVGKKYNCPFCSEEL